MAPSPHSTTANLIHPPISGTAVQTRTSNTPRTMRPINGQCSLVRPSTHCPTSPPTTTMATYNDAYQMNSADIPTNKPTTVMQAMIAAMGTPKQTNTPNPKDAPYRSALATDWREKSGKSKNTTSPNKIRAAAQIACHK